jgi:hypothetical protein
MPEEKKPVEHFVWVSIERHDPNEEGEAEYDTLDEEKVSGYHLPINYQQARNILTFLSAQAERLEAREHYRWLLQQRQEEEDHRHENGFVDEDNVDRTKCPDCIQLDRAYVLLQENLIL